jgi:hypothetical protein
VFDDRFDRPVLRHKENEGPLVKTRARAHTHTHTHTHTYMNMEALPLVVNCFLTAPIHGQLYLTIRSY